MNHSRHSTVLLLFIFVCIVVFVCVDHLATRPVEIRVEDFRTQKNSDEDCLLAALQAARQQGANWWWINNAETVIILDDMVDYHIDPVLYDMAKVPIIQQKETGEVLLAWPIPAITTR